MHVIVVNSLVNAVEKGVLFNDFLIDEFRNYHNTKFKQKCHSMKLLKLKTYLAFTHAFHYVGVARDSIGDMERGVRPGLVQKVISL